MPVLPDNIGMNTQVSLQKRFDQKHKWPAFCRYCARIIAYASKPVSYVTCDKCIELHSELDCHNN